MRWRRVLGGIALASGLLFGASLPIAARGARTAETRQAVDRLERASDRAWEEVVRALGAGEGGTLRGLRWDLWNTVTVIERDADRLLGRVRDDDDPPELGWDLLRLERRVATLRWLAPRARLDEPARKAIADLGQAADTLVALHRAEIDRIAAEGTRGFEPARLSRRDRARLLRAIERLGEQAERLESAAAPLVPEDAAREEPEPPAENDPGAMPMAEPDDPRVFIRPSDERWRSERVTDAALQVLDFALLARGLAREAPDLAPREQVLRLLTLVRVQRAVVRALAAAEGDLPRSLLDRWSEARAALGKAARLVGVPLPVS